MGRFARSFAVLVLLVTTILAVAQRPQAQASNPLAGGVWDRYSIKDAKGTETGSPGWFFLTFTPDGQYFITGVPKGHEKLSKAAKEMTKDELVGQLQGIQVRRGRYTLTGTGPYMLTLTDEINPLSPNLQGSCPTAMPCEIRIENGEVRLSTANGGVRTQWRRVAGRGTSGS
jgi:hypothetical protein